MDIFFKNIFTKASVGDVLPHAPALSHVSHRFHIDRTLTSPRRFILKTTREGARTLQKGGVHMFLGLEWYWWIVIVMIIVIPLKVKFVNWWMKRQQERRENECGKWGDEQ